MSRPRKDTGRFADNGPEPLGILGMLPDFSRDATQVANNAQPKQPLWSALGTKMVLILNFSYTLPVIPQEAAQGRR